MINVRLLTRFGVCVVSYLRSPCFVSSLPVDYISNIGVTLMRMGRSFEAKAAFERALQLEPNFDNARENLEELLTWMKERDLLDDSGVATQSNSSGSVHLDSGTDTVVTAAAAVVELVRARPEARGQKTTRDSFGHLQHHTSALPRVSFQDLDTVAMNEFAFGKRPFVITDLQNSSLWAESTALREWNFQWFADHFGDKSSDFYPGNMGRAGVHPYIVPLEHALTEASNPSGTYPTE